MLNRSGLLLLLAGALAGYAFGGKNVQAQQPDPLPFSVGDTVTLGFAEHAAQASFGRYIECTVNEIRGEYVKCGPRSLSGGVNQNERWLSLKYVVQVTRRER